MRQKVVLKDKTLRKCNDILVGVLMKINKNIIVEPLFQNY
jgi:hypothetical protein